MKRRLATLALLAAVALALLAGVAGGLLRAGIVLGEGNWLARAGLDHAALMLCGFFGTVIAVERAVAARHAAAWSAPVVSGVATALLLSGERELAGALWIASALAFATVSAVLWNRQRAAHTALLVAASIAWLAGNALWLARGPVPAVLACWFAFLVVTVAAERLEMTRLMRRRPGAQPALLLVLAALAAGAVLSMASPLAGGVLFGAALVALAAWLLAFDIARVTVRGSGLPRYMATCLLAGYFWLAGGGVAWMATSLGWPARDAALHALGLGFVVGMVFAHAPVILPAVARVKLLYGPWFYLPLAALHASLLLRLAVPAWRAQGAALNAIALALFALVVVGSAWGWRRRHGTPRTPSSRIA